MAPPTNADLGNYEILTDFDFDFAPVRVTKFRSKKTGLQVVLGQHKAPITNVYFVVATEAFDDTGLPHTLEHLTFLGSKSYPYKGVLDNLASRSGADGTSAWTGVDHTAYAITCAGSEGLLRMLPIFLDHILHPTLTQAGFVTEVYHVNGKGEEGGVVFAEMQGKEHTIERSLQRELNRQINPPGSAYRSVTGGLINEIRKLDIGRIREFHAKYYKPWNICLHVDGDVPVGKLLRVLNNVIEPMILDNMPSGVWHLPPLDWTRPFVATASALGPAIEADKKRIIRFAEDDESSGEAIMAWKGPRSGDHLEQLALHILAAYLSESDDSPMHRRLICKGEPDCTSINFEVEGGATYGEIDVTINGIPHDANSGAGNRLHQIDLIVKDALREIKFGEDELTRMKIIVERNLQKLRKSAEESATDILINAVIQDFLYGKTDGSDLRASCGTEGCFVTLSSWTSQQWNALVQRYFDRPSVTIIGEPSKQVACEAEEEHAAHLRDIKSRLGEEGLETKAEQLSEAERENEQEMPLSVYEDVPSVGVSKVDWIPVQSASGESSKRNGLVDDIALLWDPKAEHVDLPYQIHYSHVASNFITVRVIMNTGTIAPALRPYVALYLESFFSLPVLRERELRNHEQVAADLAKITVSYDAKLSLQDSFDELLQIAMVIEPANYAAAISWLRDLLTRSVFDSERINVVISKLVQSLPDYKRNAAEMTVSLMYALVQDKAHSTAAATGIWHRLSFIPALRDEMANEPQSVLEKLSKIREIVTDSTNLRISVAGNILALERPRGSWVDNFIQLSPCTMNPLPDPIKRMTTLGVSPNKTAVILPLSSANGSEASVYARGPQGWSNSELGACKVAAAVLHATESFLWKGIRGAGLAYHTQVIVNEELGCLTFRVWSSPNAVKAIVAARDIVAGLARGEVTLNDHAVAAGKGALLFAYANKERNASEAALTVMVNEVYKGVPADYNARFLASLTSITVEDVREAMIKYFVPLFDPSSSITAITCAPGLTATVRGDLESAGYKVETRSLP